MLEQASSHSSDNSQQSADALSRLRAEINAEQRERQQETYVGRALSAATEWWHGCDDSTAKLEQLTLSTPTGSVDSSQEATVQSAIAADQKARQERQKIVDVGAGIVKASGLFLQGWAGFAVTGMAYAADNAKPTDQWQTQLVDAGLGSAKGLMTKSALEYLGHSKLGIAGTGVLTGATLRMSDYMFTPSTYYDANGKFDWALGVKRVGAGTLDIRAAASDLVVFGLADAALGKFNRSTGRLLSENRFYSTVATGGVFGAATGSVDEIQRQQKMGESFDLDKVFAAAGTHAVIDAVSAIPGGLQARSLQMRALKSPEVAGVGAGQAARQGAELATRLSGAHGEIPALANRVAPNMVSLDSTGLIESTIGSERRGNTLAIERNLPGSSSKQYQIISSDGSPVKALQASKLGYSFLKVKELSPSGNTVGPEKSMLIQHLDDQVPINLELAARADLIATCNPDLLPDMFRSKHIFHTSQGSLWLTETPSGKLDFTLQAPVKDGSLRGAKAESVQLGSARSVSDIITDPNMFERKRLGQLHDLGEIAKVMREFKQPAVRLIGGGADSLVVQLADGNVLKISDWPWYDEFGHRTLKTPDGTIRRMDARLLADPVHRELPDKPLTYYIQQFGQVPVSLRDLERLESDVKHDGRWEFWDEGTNQLMYVPLPNGKRGVVLQDYYAVLPPAWLRADWRKPFTSDNEPSYLQSLID